MQWINRASHPDITPPTDRPLLCFCQEWSDIGYQAAMYKDGRFVYDEQPNEMFDQCVTDWTIFIEAD